MEKNKQVVAQLVDASKSYNNKPVLQNMQLSIEANTIIGIIGPSGAGKSTTVKTLMGMEKLDTGKAEILGVQMPNRKILGQIGYMGQSDALYEQLSAKENLQFYGELMGIAKDTLQQKISENMRLVQLEPFLNDTVAHFSGGMKRRLSLAITLLADPLFLVLDEPTSGIDPALRLTIWDQLRTLAQSGKGLMVTTHMMEDAEKCDKIALIMGGKRIAWGTPAELKAQYQAQTIEEVFLKAEEAFQLCE